MRTQYDSTDRPKFRQEDFDQLTKKERVLELRRSGLTDLREISRVAETSTSYAASVLRDSGLLNNYADLYTSTSEPANVYSKLFKGKLGFKNMDFARASVDILNAAYHRFRRENDRPGQHHVLNLALTMLDRARWSGKDKEAGEFRHWLIDRLYD